MIRFFKDIPGTCFWLFKYNYQGLKHWLGYRELEKLMKDKERHQDSKEVEDATEAYAAAQFACEYGRVGDDNFRECVEELWEKNVVTRAQLRLLIEGGELKNKDNGAIEIKKPHFAVTASGIVMLPLYLFTIFGFSSLIIFSPVQIIIKIVLLLFFNGIFFICTYALLYYSLMPYLVFRKQREKIKKFIEDRARTNQSRLIVIK